MERLSSWRACFVALAVLLAVAVPQISNAAVVVKTVPLDPSNPTSPHFTYPLDSTHEVTIVLGATVDLGGSTDSFTYSWNFGDGSAPTAATAITQPLDLSVQHQYPASAAGGTQWTAVLTVTDTKTNTKYTGNYYVIQQANNLASRVNVAIDSGLWYLHQSEWHCNDGKLSGGVYVSTPTTSCGVGGTYGANGIYGGWDAVTFGCVITPCYANYYYEGINGANINAFEVNGHLEGGPSSDPYTQDVSDALARMIMLLGNSAVTSKSVNYKLPSCGTPPCTYTFDGNTNGQAVYVTTTSYPMYQGGMIIDALVASGTPGATAHTGAAAGSGLPGINGEKYKDIVQDMVDGYNYCQNTYNSATGLNSGAWGYYCPPNSNYNDNSVSQWAAIGEIAASRGFGIATPAVVTDGNQAWLNQDQCTTGAITGAFGYNQSCYEPWGSWAVTPSGTVQLSMDSVGRGSTLWDLAETYYHDNFCNAVTPGSAGTVPRAYTYGMFSFTKSMLLHSPGGVLTPITYLEDEPGGTNKIDWYNSVGSESGGADACDGVAQTLVKRQGTTGGINGGTVGSPNPTNPQGGYWEGHYYNGGQDYFETAWSIIMLRKTVFVSCVSNLGGKGTPSGRAPARIDLTWTGINGAASYEVLRGTASGGPYTEEGTTTVPAYSDTKGLTNGDTYYYVLQPLNNAGGAICQSNQATIAIPSTPR